MGFLDIQVEALARACNVMAGAGGVVGPTLDV